VSTDVNYWQKQILEQVASSKYLSEQKKEELRMAIKGSSTSVKPPGGFTIRKAHCFVVAATYVDFARFCTSEGVDPKSHDIIYVNPISVRSSLLGIVNTETDYFVFLSDWDRVSLDHNQRKVVIDTVNSYTMRSVDPDRKYRREL
jgi:hypothetical protein